MPEHLIYQSFETGQIEIAERGVKSYPHPADNRVHAVIESDDSLQALQIFAVSGRLTHIEQQMEQQQQAMDENPYADDHTRCIATEQFNQFRTGLRQARVRGLGLFTN